MHEYRGGRGLFNKLWLRSVDGTVGASPRVQPGPGYFLSTDTVVYQLPLGIVCPAFVYQIKFLRRP